MAKVRIVIGMMGMDQHEVGAIAVSRILMEAGIEVIYLGRFQSPQSMANAAIDEAADAIGISCHSWEYLNFVPDLLKLLKKKGSDISVVVGGSVITAKDKEQLLSIGVAGVFEAGVDKTEMVKTIKSLVA
jgi:methylmalonyl-CoA mutase, C-terminal domain